MPALSSPKEEGPGLLLGPWQVRPASLMGPLKRESVVWQHSFQREGGVITGMNLLGRLAGKAFLSFIVLTLILVAHLSLMGKRRHPESVGPRAQCTEITGLTSVPLLPGPVRMVGHPP